MLALSLLVAGLASAGSSAASVIFLGEVEYRLDSEQAWRLERFHRLPHTDEILHVRAPTELPPELELPVALRIQALATCEVTWDDVDLDAAGRVGASAREEVPGPLRQVLHVPDRLATPGVHRLELRCSMRHRGFVPSAGFWTLEVGPYEELVRRDEVGLAFALISISGMVLVGLFALAGWVYARRVYASRDASKRSADLWLSVFCLGAAALALTESLRLLVDYSYDWHIWRLRLIGALAWLVALVLVVYVVRRFPRPGARRWTLAVAAGTAACLVLFRSWDGKATAVFLVALPAAAWWCIRAFREGRRGAVAAGLGVLICAAVLLWEPLAFIDRNLYVAVDVLLLCLLVGHARENAGLRREREEAKLAASRLEAELLRRQLQPHFLMNTLTALSEWIEEDPETAVSMIEALAGELRTLHAVSDRRTISVGEELELCRGHLDVMSLRRGVRYRLEMDGVDLEASIPPAVLHTLVENAVTHGASSNSDSADDEVCLSLRQRIDGARRVLIFDAPLGGETMQRRGTGAGLRYVEARLREAYGETARFEAGPTEGAWRTRLELPVDRPSRIPRRDAP